MVGREGAGCRDSLCAGQSALHCCAARTGPARDRLMPLLADILELLPWVARWHPEPDAETGEPAARELEDSSSTNWVRSAPRGAT